MRLLTCCITCAAKVRLWIKTSGMSPQNIQKLEQGRAKGIQLDTLDALCEALGCKIQEILVRVPA